ncbi:MAG: acetate--CoA ligase family protein [Acidimicrobiia bacterium]
MTRTLSEPESKSLLASYGVPCVTERVVADADAAVAAARELGFPVVAKLAGDGIAHKTERGLVRLGLSTPEEVAAAAGELLAAARPDDGEVAVLVAPMVQGIRELIVGVHRDPQFGPCVMVGIGGVLAEALADVAFRLAPIEPADAEEMLDDLAAQALLGPVRGEAPVDRAAVAAVLLALSRLAGERDDVVSVDVNPLLVDTEGTPIAVDALVETK